MNLQSKTNEEQMIFDLIWNYRGKDLDGIRAAILLNIGVNQALGIYKGVINPHKVSCQTRFSTKVVLKSINQLIGNGFLLGEIKKGPKICKINYNKLYMKNNSESHNDNQSTLQQNQSSSNQNG